MACAEVALGRVMSEDERAELFRRHDTYLAVTWRSATRAARVAVGDGQGTEGEYTLSAQSNTECA